MVVTTPIFPIDADEIAPDQDVVMELLTLENVVILELRRSLFPLICVVQGAFFQNAVMVLSTICSERPAMMETMLLEMDVIQPAEKNVVTPISKFSSTPPTPL